MKIGPVTVQGRWHFSYTGENPSDDFKLTVGFTLAERKKLVNLKKGDWATVTADQFGEMRLYLSEVEYINGVTITFLRKQPLS